MPVKIILKIELVVPQMLTKSTLWLKCTHSGRVLSLQQAIHFKNAAPMNLSVFCTIQGLAGQYFFLQSIVESNFKVKFTRVQLHDTFSW